MTAPIRVALVGCGVIGDLHSQVITASPEFELPVLVDTDLAVADALAKSVEEQGGARPATTADLQEALARDDVDAVAVCTPSGAHAAIAVAALRAGKHVIVEKPIDVTLEAAREIADAAAAAPDRTVSVISQHRLDPGSVVISQAIEDGKLCRVTSAVASVAWWRGQGYYDSGDWRGTVALDGGGALMNQGVHTLDLLVWFLGTPVEIFAHTALLAHERMEVEDTVVATITFESGALAVLHATTAAYPGLTVRLAVHGSRGSAVLDNDRLLYFHVADPDDEGSVRGAAGADNQARELVGDIESSERVGDPEGFFKGHARQYADIAAAITEGRRPAVTIEDATTALRAVHAVYASARLGRPVRFDEELSR
jgi:UDP-N-acetyl-2-amino-2-deoxyglucuronate dehydrogenase